MNPVRIVPDANYPGMFRLQWEDGVISAGVYNSTRAKDILRNYEGYCYRQTVGARLRGWRLGGRKGTADAFSEGE